MTSTTAQYLCNNLSATIGTFHDKPVQIIREENFYRTDKKFLCIAETAALVLNGMVYGHLEHDGRSLLVNEVRTPYAYRKVLASDEVKKSKEEKPKAEETKVEVPDPVIADVAIGDLIDATLKGLTLDEMLSGFTIGLG